MKLGKKTTWDKIEVDEVFALRLALSGCQMICVKLCPHEFMYIADSEPRADFTGETRLGKIYLGIYKLSPPTQRLWRSD